MIFHKFISKQKNKSLARFCTVGFNNINKVVQVSPVSIDDKSNSPQGGAPVSITPGNTGPLFRSTEIDSKAELWKQNKVLLNPDVPQGDSFQSQHRGILITDKTVKKDEEKKEIKTEDKSEIVNNALPKVIVVPYIGLGFDSSLPGAPDKDKKNDENRHLSPRELNLPFIRFNEKGLELINPLLVSGIKENKKGDGLELLGSKLNPKENFATMDLPSQSVASLFDVLSEKFPAVEKNVLYRLAKVGTFVAIDVPLMVASHEMGHAGAGSATCPLCNPSVNITNWMSGYTSYNAPAGVSFSDKEKLFMSVAGMNQATFNGEEIDRRMHTKGADIANVVQYLVNITNNANYQVKDWIKNSPPGYNDGATYHKMMEERNKGWNQGSLSSLAVGVNLLNVDFWASLIGGINYVATGKQVKLPEIKLGGAAVSFPHFSLLNTYEGPQLNTSIYGHLENSKPTLELKYSTLITPDNGPGMGVELRLHNLDVPGTNNLLSVSPRVGVSAHDGQPGYKIGGEIDFKPFSNKNFAFSTGMDYNKNYLPEAYLPFSEGFQGMVGFKAGFM